LELAESEEDKEEESSFARSLQIKNRSKVIIFFCVSWLITREIYFEIF
jgi:hypothetical protein